MRFAAIAIISSLFACVATAQKKPPARLDLGYRDMYNLDFADAHQVFNDWEAANPQDPLGPVSDAAAYLFAEFDHLHVLETELFTNDEKFERRSKPVPDSNARQAFEAELNRADQIAGSVLARNPKDANAQFAQVLALGLRGDYAALIENRDMLGLSYMKKARLLAEHLLQSNPDYYDAYLAVGIENYLLSLKPAPARWILRITGAQTDREVGLRKLRLTAEKGHYLLPYARLLLAVAALRDGNPQQACSILDGLAREFPKNHLYARELAKLQ